MRQVELHAHRKDDSLMPLRELNMFAIFSTKWGLTTKKSLLWWAVTASDGAILTAVDMLVPGPEHQPRFPINFYAELLNNKWTPKKWNGPVQLEDPTGQLMMTPADMAFVQDPAFRKYAEEYVNNPEKFEKDFAKAYSKLLHLGVPGGKGGKGGKGGDNVNFPVALAAVIGVAATARLL